MEDKIIKAYMALKGISQKELAKIVGVAPSTLNLKINNKSTFARDEMIIMARALDVSVEELFFKETISNMKIDKEV